MDGEIIMMLGSKGSQLTYTYYNCYVDSVHALSVYKKHIENFIFAAIKQPLKALPCYKVIYHSRSTDYDERMQTPVLQEGCKDPS